MSTLPPVELGVLGPLQVRRDDAPVVIPGAKPRAVLTMLGLHHGSVVAADTLVELLWGEDPPRTAAKALQTHISSLRRALGDGFVLTQGTGWALAESEVDASRYKSAARLARDAAAAGDISQAVAHFEEALALWRGVPELPDGRRGTSEKTRWIEGHAALVEDRADALLATGRAAEVIGELESAVAEAPLRERRWGQLMLALYRAGRQGDALAAFKRARTVLAEELGVDPGPELRRLETAIVAQDATLEVVAAENLPSVMRAVTFLLTDIEGSTAAWEADADAMALALARHDELVEQVVTSRGGRLIKTRGEGDATFSVFERPSAAAAAALELQDAIVHEQWNLREPMRIRIALHTGEVELRDGDYFGRAVNRAARLRSLATGGQILCSGATAELVIDSLPEDVVLADLGMRQLRNLARPEHVFELRLETAAEGLHAEASDTPLERPGLPAVLTGSGPFVGRGRELEGLVSAWQIALAGGAHAVLIAGEPGVGKTRLAGEWSQQAYQQGAVVLYGRCDEDLGAPYQPFTEALRSLVPCLGSSRLRATRGVEALLPLVPGLTDVLPDLATPTRADPDTERYALFDAVVALLETASAASPVVLVLDDLHWAAKPTLLLLRHFLRFGDHARVQIVGTYRSTDLDRSHPLAAMLADLHRDGTSNRINLSGLDEDDVSAYVAKAGYDDEELGRALASVTGGNPFFLIEALRHVDESGGRWDPSTLPQGVREAVSRRLSRLPVETNKALAAAAVVGSRFALELVEKVVGEDLVDAFDEACKAGLVIEEPGGRYRFNHALVRQSLLAELPSMRRMRLHQRIAVTLETQPGADDELLAELAHHYFECAWAGNAAKAVEYCRRAADQAMARLGYEGAADLYDHALHALEEIDDELPDRDDQAAELLVARCEALLAAGDVTSAVGAVSQLQQATVHSGRLAAWATCFEGQLSMLIHPERLDEAEIALSTAASKLAELDDAAGEAKAHTVRAGCLARLGRIGDCEVALDDALTAARRARDHRRVNAVLAGAPLAALWGPNPVPRAGGRCLDVVRLLRITTDSPAVEATSTRCQAVLEAFRGREQAARRMIDSARRTVTELGLRHALLEVEQFAGIVELLADDPEAAEPRLRKACNGFRRMGLDADTAETAALLGRACLALNRDAEADELCTESERLAGHAFKPAIAWRTLRAQLLARQGDHNEARRVAQAAITLAERTDALVDHGDACLALATVLRAAGDAVGARAAAERAANLYERKGAVALAEKARQALGVRDLPSAPTEPKPPHVELDNACVRAIRRGEAAIEREAWDEVEELYATDLSMESRRKIVGFTRDDLPTSELRRLVYNGGLRLRIVVIAVRGERLALTRLAVGTADVSPGAPNDELLHLFGLDENGRIALQVSFDIEDMDAALTELDATHARFEAENPQTRRLENACVRAVAINDACLYRGDWDEFEQQFAADMFFESRRKIVGFSGADIPSGNWQREIRRVFETGEATLHRHVVVAVRGERLALYRAEYGPPDVSPGAAREELLQLLGIDEDGRFVFEMWFDIEDMDAAIAELDAAHARFEEAQRRVPLENAASRADDRVNELFAGRRWDEIDALLADDVRVDDRRRGLHREGADHATELANARAIADIGVKNLTSRVLAIRGQRLALTRTVFSGRDQRPEAFHTEILRIAEIDTDEQIVAYVAFDLDDFDAAIAELDARYLAGEAAAHAHTWSVVAAAYAGFNRRELLATTPDWVNIDHRRGAAFADGDMIAYVQAAWDDSPDTKIYIGAVHRLSKIGAVVTHLARGISQEGFDAEWRDVNVLAVKGDMVSRSELFNEGDLDAAIARFDELSRPARRLENAASRASDRYFERVGARDWDAVAGELAVDYYTDDRRHVVGGAIHGRDAEIASVRVQADLGVTHATPTVIAVRGERLALSRVRYSGRNQESEAFVAEMLIVFEIDADDRFAAAVAFDLDDFDAASAELDARYLAGEAAAYAHTWSALTGAFAAINRHELPELTPDWVNIDHRRGAAFATGDMTAYIHDLFDDAPDINVYIEVVHRLNNVGAVVTAAAHGTSQQGFKAEWREIQIFARAGDLLSRCELFDEADVDTALARFEELHPRERRLENAASQAIERYSAHFAARDWDALAKVLADDISMDDRRRVVNGGIRHGRDAEIANLRATADAGFMYITSVVIAARGERLILTRTAGSSSGSEEFLSDALGVLEINSHNQIAAIVIFDHEDFDAAIAELDARYVAGEAAAHSRTWSAIADVYAALNRREMPATAPDLVDIDHRSLAAIGSGDLMAYLQAAREDVPRSGIYIETVHRLTDLGAVTTHVAKATSREGFDAEWRITSFFIVGGDLVNRYEIFDEADLDDALARFEELHPKERRLENTASRVDKRFQACFAARDWDVMAEMLSEGFSIEDRRRVVNMGNLHGRDAELGVHAYAAVGTQNATATVIATRTQRLALSHYRFSGHDQTPDAFRIEMLVVVEIDADERMAAVVVFDADDFDAAIAELDARYLAGEAAPFAHVWSAISRAYAAMNRRELPPTTPNWENLDHRQARAFAPGDAEAYVHATWDLLAPDFKMYIEVVHRLSKLGVVVTRVTRGTSQEGFDAEWREVCFSTAEGDLINRSEIFDEADLDTAIARFEELHPSAPRLENTASQVVERFSKYFAARHWDAMAETMADDFCTHDRRRVANAGVLHGRAAHITNMRAVAEVGFEGLSSTVIATRGQRLALIRFRTSMRGSPPGEVIADVVGIVEIDADNRLVAAVHFDSDDIDAAFEELDARFLAGEAAAHAHTWSLVAAAYACYNRRELPATTPDWVNVDRRRMTLYAPGDVFKYVRGGWNYISDISFRIEAVHQLSNLGAVITHAGRGTSQEGFDAEWREIHLMTVEGDLFNRSEMFDEADLDAAIARFDQLSRSAPRLENAASQAYERFRRCFAARNWAAMAELLTADTSVDDHRRVVNAEIRRGRDVEIANMRAFADIGTTMSTATVIASRGERLVLCRTCISRDDPETGGFRIELLIIVETTADKRILARVAYDPDDFDAAVAELDARFVAGEAAAHTHTWSVISGVFAALRRRELPSTTTDFVDIDHRKGTAFAPGELMQYLRAGWEINQEVRPYVEAVHRLNSLGAVVTHSAQLTSREGFEAEWRTIDIMTVDGDLINRAELFDEADLDNALARFEELHAQPPRLENTASRVDKRFQACFAARDWDVMAKGLSDGFSIEDRRRVVNMGNSQGRDAELTVHAYATVGTENVKSTVIATRAQRLALNHYVFSGHDQRPDAFRIEMLVVVEIDADERMAAVVVFDADDIDAAIAELDARYLAGEAAAHAHTWSAVLRPYTAINRREIFATTPDWVSIDHRRGAAFAPGDANAYVRASLDDGAGSIYVETVHRLSDLGAVVTWTAAGTTEEGFDAEWRGIHVLTVDGDLLSRFEVFDEADIETAITRFDQLGRPAPRLENAASRVNARFLACVAARDWDAIASILADHHYSDDRRRVTGAGTRRGRDADIQNIRAITDLGGDVTAEVVMTRGDRLALTRTRVSFDQQQQGFLAEALVLAEIDLDSRIAATVIFELDDVDATIAELDARYLADEAAPFADTWSAVAGFYAALNRHEILATPDWVNVDHRRATTVVSGDMAASIRATWDVAPNITRSVEAVHRLNNLGVVVTHTADGTSREGFDAEWRLIALLTFTGDLVNRCELFDEADLDAAIARFDQLSQPAPQLENAASRAYERLTDCFVARDEDALTEILADDISTDDCRRIVGAGVHHGRAAVAAEMSAIAELGVRNHASAIVATRGERLVLSRARTSGRNKHAEAFHVEVLDIVEINAQQRVVARVVFDPDDFDAAIAELESRYITGEAAAYAHTWSVITRAYALLNRREHPATTPDWVNIDHRRGISFAPGDVSALLVNWNATPDPSNSIEAVHRLNDLGAVVTSVTHETSQEGFEAEWRGISVLTIKGDLIDRLEIFDEADLDAALARFDELQPQAPQLENAASQVAQRFLAHFAAGDWDAMAEILADDYSSDDRRRVVGAGVRHGRDAQIVDMGAIADVWITKATSTVIATRGERLVLIRVRHSDRDEGPEAFLTEVLVIGEIDGNERIVASVAFDVEDREAAFEELDARFLACETAAHAHVWSIVAASYAALNRHEIPQTTPDCVNVDHRRETAFGPDDLTAYQNAGLQLDQGINIHVEAVHQLNSRGAVITYAAHETSPHGFDAEWRGVAVFTIDGDLVNRVEVFDEADLDAALARFDELHPPTRRLENAATRMYERLQAYYATRNWAAITEIVSDDLYSDDRRPVVGGRIQHGRDALIKDLRATADVGVTNATSYAVATRGERLAVTHARFSQSHEQPEAFHVDFLQLVAIDADERIAAVAAFDPDDFDAAIAELDARYLAGEAAAYAHTWSVITRAYAALNRREHPATTPDWVNIDHRRGISFAPGDMSALLVNWNATPDPSNSIEAVHRLNDLGAVVTSVTNETSQQGFEAEWRGISVLTIEGDLIDRLEIFDEADLDAALERFDELQPPTRRLENTASQVGARYRAHFAAGNWDAMADLIADDFFGDDRRRVVGSGVRIGREAQIADMRAIADLFIANMTWTNMATRGDRLVLFRVGFLDRDHKPDAFRTEVLCILEVDADERIVASVSFDLDDVDAAFEELDARYLAGEAAAHSDTWSVIARFNDAFNRQEIPPTDWVTIDHRPLITADTSDLPALIRDVWGLTPDLSIHIEAVHQLSSVGAVVTREVHGTSREGFDAEWRMIQLLTVEGDRISRSELFDEKDIEAALARFEELHPQTPRLEHPVQERFLSHFAARDWDAMGQDFADDYYCDDRRRVVNAGVRYGRDAAIEDLRVADEIGLATNITSDIIATRGERLFLIRARWLGPDQRPEDFYAELLNIIEIDSEEKIAAQVMFDPNDIDAAFAELDARYLAGKAAYAQTWSVVTEAYAAFNRHELPAADWVTIDRRRATPFESSTMTEILRAIWDLTPDLKIHIEAVHQLDSFGAVIIHTASGSSPEGFDAEWRAIDTLTVEGDRITGCEIFDEADLDAALARFDELHPQAGRLENAASQAVERFWKYFAAREWAALADTMADDICSQDRRRVVNGGEFRGPAAHVTNMRAVAEVGFEGLTSTVIATRGQHLTLIRIRSSMRGSTPGEVAAEMLSVIEIDTDNRLTAAVIFGGDDFDAAFEELDARYLAHGASGYADTWAVIAHAYTAVNRHELPPTTPDWVNIDHRRGRAFAPGDLEAYLNATWDLAPDVNVYVEAVHRLSNLGGVVTHCAHGSSREGFDAEWREVILLTFEAGRVNHFEVFDEADVDAALARFDELDRL